MRAIAAAAVMVTLAGAASAQTLDDLKNDGKNPDNVLTYGMGYSLNRYSPLKQIDKATVTIRHGGGHRFENRMESITLSTTGLVALRFALRCFDWVADS
jgi:hypothetical protein